MKLSTFAKGFRKFYLSQDCWTLFLCVAADLHTKRLKNKTKNSKLHKEYQSHRVLCREFISNAIEGKDTVVEYLHSKGLPSDMKTVFRLNLLNDMIDWAEAQEQSHQL